MLKSLIHSQMTKVMTMKIIMQTDPRSTRMPVCLLNGQRPAENKNIPLIHLYSYILSCLQHNVEDFYFCRVSVGLKII